MKKNKMQNLNQQFIERYKIDQILNNDLLQKLRLVEFAPGKQIIESLEPIQDIFFFVEGKAKVYYLLPNGKHFLARFYTPFEVVGDVELFKYDYYICSMTAITAVKCLALDVKLIKENTRDITDFLIYICQSLGGKLAQANRAGAENLMYPLNQRLAAYLLAVLDQHKSYYPQVEQIYTENLSELSDLLGCSYRQLTRVIKNFKDRNIIIKKDKVFIIEDLPALKKLAKNIFT